MIFKQQRRPAVIGVLHLPLEYGLYRLAQIVLVLVKAHVPRIIQVVKVKHHRQLLAGICRGQLGGLNT